MYMDREANTMRRSPYALLIMSLAVVLLGACTPTPVSPAAPAPEQPPAQAGGDLIVAMQSDVDGLDPHKTETAPTFDVAKSLYDTLVDVNSQGALIPGLAESWDVSSDGTQWTFHLRSNVFFHNGRRLVASDVKFSLERVRELSPRGRDYTVIERIETPDDKTVVVYLAHQAPAFLSNLAYGWAAIVPPEAADNLRNHPVGTGPFEFVEWVPDSHIRLKRFDRYFIPGQPRLDSITFKIITEPAVQLTSLKLGEVDIAVIQPQNAAEVEATPGLKVLSAPLNMVALLAINLARPPFDDLRVRRALNYAIDKQTVVEGAQFGYGTIIGSHMPPVSEYYVDLSDRYPYDPQKAKELLAEAGYPDGFETTISFANFDLHRRNAEIIASQLAQVGIKAKLQAIELATWLDQVYRGRNFELNTLTHTGRLDPDPFLNRFVCDHPENYRNYCNPRFDALIKEGASTTDVQRRKEIYAELQRILADDAVAVWLYAPHALVGLREEVEGYQFRPISGVDYRQVYKTR